MKRNVDHQKHWRNTEVRVSSVCLGQMILRKPTWPDIQSHLLSYTSLGWTLEGKLVFRKRVFRRFLEYWIYFFNCDFYMCVCLLHVCLCITGMQFPQRSCFSLWRSCWTVDTTDHQKAYDPSEVNQMSPQGEWVQSGGVKERLSWEFHHAQVDYPNQTSVALLEFLLPGF